MRLGVSIFNSDKRSMDAERAHCRMDATTKRKELNILASRGSTDKEVI